MTAFRFENPMMLLALLGLLPYCIAIIYRNRRRRFPWSRIFLTSTIFFCIVIGLARPQLGHTETQAQAMRSQIFFAIDVSKSMLAEDLPPSRLLFAKAFLQRMLPQLESTKIAVFPLTQTGYLQLPLTNDWNAATDIIASLNPNLVSNTGTDLSQSLTNLFSLISRLEERSKTAGTEWFPTQVVLISDGETHAPLDMSLLRRFKNKKIPIHTVAAGTAAGGMIPSDRRGFDSAAHLRDAGGKTVITKLNVDNLRTISRESGGSFFVGRFEELASMVRMLKQAAVMGRLATSFKVEQEIFPLFFIIAFFLMTADLLTRRWGPILTTRTVGIILFLICATGSAETPERENKAIEMDDTTRSIYLFNQGVEQLKSNNHKKAAELFQESAAITPDKKLKKQALYNLGNSLFKQVDPSQAIEAYQQAFDVPSGDRRFEKEANTRISENMVLATQLLEEIKKMQKQGESNEPSQDEDGKGGNPNDPKGPKQFQAQEFDENQKKKIFDLIASEEQQTMQRMMEGRNRNQASSSYNKPW